MVEPLSSLTITELMAERERLDNEIRRRKTELRNQTRQLRIGRAGRPPSPRCAVCGEIKHSGHRCK